MMAARNDDNLGSIEILSEPWQWTLLLSNLEMTYQRLRLWVVEKRQTLDQSETFIDMSTKTKQTTR